jgi:hypothetical protein
VTVVSEAKKRRVRAAAILGAVSGLILFAGLYFFTGSLIYVFFIPVASALGAGQVYMMTEDRP